jgi:hypothetical protein
LMVLKVGCNTDSEIDPTDRVHPRRWSTVGSMRREGDGYSVLGRGNGREVAEKVRVREDT